MRSRRPPTIAYSASNNYSQVRRACESVHLLNTINAGVNPYKTAASVALLGIKPGTSQLISSNDAAAALRVLHVTPFFAPAWVYGGLPESAYQFARNLARAGEPGW